MTEVEERVDRLEEALRAFVTNVGIEFNKVYNLQMRTELELKEFKEDGQRQIREMNKKWGELANKMGTLVEDLVRPGLPRIVLEFFGQEVRDFMINRRKKLPDGRVHEYDAIAVTDERVVLNSTKSTLRSEYINQFAAEIEGFREVLPEYRDYPLIGVLATLSVQDDILKYAEKQGFLVLAVGDQIMEIVNHEGFEPRRW